MKIHKMQRDPSCTLCTLHQQANTVCLLGNGPRPSKAMIIGEAPGETEDSRGMPFVGRSGQLLDETLQRCGISRADVFVTNAVHCRPPANRTPSKKEIKTCKAWLDYEMAFVQPKFVLLLGNAALQSVLGVQGINKLRGTPIERDGVIYLPAYHPSYVLRSEREGRSLRATFEADIERFKQIIDFGGIPFERKISNKIVCTWGDVDDMIDDLIGVVSADIECTCLYPWQKDAAVVTIGFGTRTTQWEVFIHHKESPWKEEDIVKILARVEVALRDCIVVMQGGKFDALWMLIHYGFKLINNFDTLLAHYIIDENSNHGLDHLARIYFNAPDWDIPLKEKQGNAPMQKIAVYHAHDLYYTRALYFVLKKKVAADPKVQRVFDKILMPCARLFVNIEERGMFLDTSKMGDAETYLRAELAKAEKSLAQWGTINWGSPKQVGNLLYDQLGITCPMKTKTGADSTSESALKQIDHPCVVDLLKFRGHKQQLSFFIEGWLPYIVGKRMHPSFKLHGTVTGRLSSEHPNCQQIPRDKRIRNIITAPPGWTLVECDLSQIEMRIAAELSQCQRLLEVFQTGGDVHWTTVLGELERHAGQVELVTETARVAKQMKKRPDFGDAIQILLDIGPDAAVEINPLWKEQRKRAKAINFGFLFGMQAPKFKAYARDNYDMIITDQEARNSRIAFFDLYPLDEWHKKQRMEARLKGFVRSLSGRKRRLPAALSHGDSYEIAEALRQAINSPVQSFANEINLMVLLQMCDEFGPDVYRPVATVHDAILQEVRNDHVRCVAERVTQIMKRPKLFDDFEITLRVPIEGDVSIGPWGAGIKLSKWLEQQRVAA